ncbi:hypothetical protein FEZ33_11655 [Ruoffia tabacinasalis]|uniref:YbbR domain-containing protein n=1 Tax=Ruoffia tabacinasalis TaxID=87458 RepID=A0A5R9DSL4_9LACT|nr:CdaR family protein [Ruoffia tabacinasalis]TLQ38571.1 hypothetical protein FEZ33_11655 [Ruoffia tabacinasalis]
MNRRLFENKWAVRLISLLFAIFLYIFVASENNAFVFQSAANQQFASINVTETIDNVPVTVGEIPENTFISGLPESVQVRITGPRNVINQVLEKEITVQTEDLTDIPSGTQQIQFIVSDLPDTVDYQVTPSRRYVKISQLEEITAEIEYEIDPNAIQDGFNVDSVSLNPQEVQLTGDVETIQQIDRVYITIANPQPSNSSFSGSYVLQIVNANGEVLDVNSNVSEIESQVEVVQPQSEVGMHIIPFGEDQAMYTYEYTITTPQSLVIQGSQPNVDTIGVVADVSGLTESTTITGELQVPEGMTVINGGDVQIEVSITPIAPSENEEQSSEETNETSEENEENNGPESESGTENEDEENATESNESAVVEPQDVEGESENN